MLDEVESVLSSISEAHQEVHDMEAHLEAVKGDITRAQADTEARLEEISLHKNVYMDANQRCKEAENLIEAETSNVDRLTVKLSEVMDQVRRDYWYCPNNPCGVPDLPHPVTVHCHECSDMPYSL